MFGMCVPRGVRLKCYYAFFLVCCGCDASYIVSVHIQCHASIYTISLCRRHSWQVRLAKQETLTPPGTWSHLWFAGVHECQPWCSIVGATVTSASVLLYFTFRQNLSDGIINFEHVTLTVVSYLRLKLTLHIIF